MKNLAILALLGAVSANSHHDHPAVECPFSGWHKKSHIHKTRWSWGMVDLQKGENETVEEHADHVNRPWKTTWNLVQSLWNWDNNRHIECPFMKTFTKMFGNHHEKKHLNLEDHSSPFYNEALFE